jgi:hypothetical protein
MPMPSVAAARSRAPRSFVLFHKDTFSILLANRKMITPDRKFHRVPQRGASPHPDPRPRNKTKLLKPVVQILGYGISANDASFSRQETVQRQVHFRHFLQSPTS